MPNQPSAEQVLVNRLGFVPISGHISLYKPNGVKENVFLRLPVKKIEFDGNSDHIKITTSGIPSERKFYLLHDPQYDRLFAVDMDGKARRAAEWKFPEGSIGAAPDPLPTCEFNPN